MNTTQHSVMNKSAQGDQSQLEESKLERSSISGSVKEDLSGALFERIVIILPYR